MLAFKILHLKINNFRQCLNKQNTSALHALVMRQKDLWYGGFIF